MAIPPLLMISLYIYMDIVDLSLWNILFIYVYGTLLIENVNLFEFRIMIKSFAIEIF